MSPEESIKILVEVQNRLLHVMDAVKDLPQGYQYKVREMLSCAETVVSMYCDVQQGIIPEVLKKDVSKEQTITEEIQVPEAVKQKTVLDISDINLDLGD